MENDPFTVYHPQAPRPVESPDPRREFWAQVPDMRNNKSHEFVATYQRCIFDTAAKRVRHYPGCEHQRPEAEDGEE
jgi:hypothetical protein